MATTIDFVIGCEGTKVWPLIFEIGKVSDYTKLFPDPLISCSYPVTHILDYVFHFDDYCYLTVSKKRFDQNLQSSCISKPKSHFAWHSLNIFEP